MTHLRARSDFSTPDDDGLLTKEAFDEALAEHGVELDARTIRMWRTRGLLPHAQRGGLARYSEDSVAQAVEAARLFGERNDESFVGWELWWRGYDVAEQWWRPALEFRQAASSLASPAVARIAGRLTRADAPSMMAAIWSLHAAATSEGRPLPRLSGPSALERLLARADADFDRIASGALDPADTAAQLLSTAARTPRPNISSLAFKTDRVGALLAARDDLRHTLEAATALRDAVALLSPAQAARLRPARWVYANAPRNLKADLILRWLAAVEERGEIIDRGALVQMRADAFATLSKAKEVSRILSGAPGIARAATRRRLSEALRRTDELDALCGRIRREMQA